MASWMSWWELLSKIGLFDTIVCKTVQGSAKKGGSFSKCKSGCGCKCKSFRSSCKSNVNVEVEGKPAFHYALAREPIKDGNGQVCDYWCADRQQEGVRKWIRLSDIADGGQVCVMNHAPLNNDKSTIETEIDREVNVPFDLQNNNCETFVNYLRSGKRFSTMVEKKKREKGVK